MITLNYSITEQEYKDFYHYLGWLAPDRKIYRVRYQLTSLVTYLALFAVLYFLTKPFSLGIPTIIVIAVVALGLYYYNNFRIKRHFYKIGQRVYDDSDKEDSEMIIGESGIIAKSKDSDAHYKWSAFIKKYETDSAYYLIMSSNIGLVIPKRVFKSMGEKESFQSMLAQYLSLQADLPIPGR